MGKGRTHTLPGYFRGKFQLIGTVTFTAFFSLLLMLVSIPFSDNAWFEIGPSKAFAFTATFFSIALMIVIISRRLMYATRRMRMTYLGFVLWIVAESVIICLLYSAFTIQGDEIGVIDISEASFIEIFGRALIYAFSSLIVPNIIAGMYFAILDKDKTIKSKKSIKDNPVIPEGRTVSLYDLGGTLKFSAKMDSIYYFESDDNYIIVWYEGKDDELSKYMIRSRLKNIEKEFERSSLVRCNRKYVVNIDKVKVMRHSASGYELILERDGIPALPVTKTYEHQIVKLLKGTSPEL